MAKGWCGSGPQEPGRARCGSGSAGMEPWAAGASGGAAGRPRGGESSAGAEQCGARAAAGASAVRCGGRGAAGTERLRGRPRARPWRQLRRGGGRCWARLRSEHPGGPRRLGAAGTAAARPRRRKIGHGRALGGGEVKGGGAAPAGLNWVREYFGKVWRTGGSR